MPVPANDKLIGWAAAFAKHGPVPQMIIVKLPVYAIVIRIFRFAGCDKYRETATNSVHWKQLNNYAEAKVARKRLPGAFFGCI